MSDIEVINRNLDLTYSVDDGGWYFTYYGQKPCEEKVSVTYKTKREAVTAYRSSQIEWDETT